jgi:hypothetical protein
MRYGDLEWRSRLDTKGNPVVSVAYARTKAGTPVRLVRHENGWPQNTEPGVPKFYMVYYASKRLRLWRNDALDLFLFCAIIAPFKPPTVSWGEGDNELNDKDDLKAFIPLPKG